MPDFNEKPMTVSHGVDNITVETVLAIEYHDGRPFSVMTHTRTDNRRKPWYQPNRDTAFTGCPQHYDFEFCKRDQQLYWHNSGSGGEDGFVVSRFAKPSPPKAKLWLAPGVTAMEYVGRKSLNRKPCGERRLLAMGYELIAAPLDLTSLHTGWSSHIGATCNPFDVAEGDTECQWCDECQDRLPDRDGRLCEHVVWCDECCWWVYEKTHVRLDSMDDEPTIHDDEEAVHA